MPKWRPCKRTTFIRRVRRLGFQGLFAGGKHQFMVLGQHRLTIPSNSEYSVPELRMMLREVGEFLGRLVTLEEWTKLG